MIRVPRRWDIFCAVVDNYGDAGVCWRLARQLASEHGLSVRLFLDALPTLARMAPAVDPARAEQLAHGVRVCRWDGPRAPFAAGECADVVVEAFGCGLPESYLAAMCARERQPVWTNLEYLSAEAWIEDCHGLPSRHPSLPLTRHFFFPGFTAASGGLLRERDLFARRDRFRKDPAARAALLAMLRVEPAEAALLVSLFCYPGAPVAALLDAWSAGRERVLCIVPEGVADAAVEAWTGGALAGAGERFSRGSLGLVRAPFLAQDAYDRLLWLCDLNFVRGEDSFVRAQWAARPLVWQPYPQAENAHRLKLEAFLERYAQGLGAEAAAALGAMSRAWSGGGDALTAWPACAAACRELAARAAGWAERLAALPDLASNLVRFCADRV